MNKPQSINLNFTAIETPDGKQVHEKLQGRTFFFSRRLAVGVDDGLTKLATRKKKKKSHSGCSMTEGAD